MSETEQLSQLISAIYDAALEVDLWPVALERTAAYIRSATATLGSIDALQSTVTFNFSWGDDPAYTKSYVERYAKLNTLLPESHNTSIGDIISVSSLASREQLEEMQFYREWAKPQGYVDVVQATLEKTPTALAVFAAVRHESVGLVDETMLRQMALLVPHFRRAILIGKVIDLKTVEAAAFADTIEAMPAGIFLVNAESQIVHANASGGDLLGQGAIVRRQGNILGALHAGADASLRQAVAASADSEIDLAGRGIDIPLPGQDGVHQVAHVLPLASGARLKTAARHGASAAVFVREARLDPATPVASVARLFGLTPAETRVLGAVLDCGGVATMAAALGMSNATVKTHLQQIFAKTGTSRQIELVKLTLGFANPAGR